MPASTGAFIMRPTIAIASSSVCTGCKHHGVKMRSVES